jgi:hypothetical protein
VNLPAFSIDGNWVDMCSVLAGMAHIAYRRHGFSDSGKLISKMTGIYFTTGVAIFPQVILTFCVFSSQLERSLLTTSNISLSVAGFCALMALLEKP